MNRLKCIVKSFNNIQIYSALLWAATIVLCSYYSEAKFVSMILVTAAGFHVILMSTFANLKTKNDHE